MPEAHRFEKRQQQEREEGYVFGGADESLGPMQDSAPNVGVGTYNEEHPKQSLGCLSPNQYRISCLVARKNVRTSVPYISKP